MNAMNEAIVIGADHHNTLGVIRALGRKGVPLRLILVSEDKRPFVAASRYIGEVVTACSESSLPNVLSDVRKDIGHMNPVVLFSCSDKVSAVLDRNRGMLESEGYVVPGTVDPNGLEYWMDKQVMADAAVASGLNVPLSGTGQYPLIAKPKKSISGSKEDIRILENDEEYMQYVSAHPDMDIQYQQFIDKDSEYQLIGCSIDNGGKVIIPGVSVILRQPRETNTGFLEYRPLDSSLPVGACMQFLKAIRYSGLFSMEFLRGKDGKDYFMEINLRNDGNAVCVTEAGVNLPYVWYLASIGKPWEDEASNRIRSILVMPEFDDFRNSVLRGEIPFFRWLKDVHRTDCFMEYAPDDKAPFFVKFRNEAIRYCKKLLKR